ncbi:MAG: CotH kinase family protein [Lachnospiraceae bacterium]|nr:CotH kinase family protein [Lachnospiraceae bacterium]
MSTSRRIDQICLGAAIGVILIMFLFLHADKLGVQAVSAVPGYESKLFQTSMVHEIEIIMDNWEDFLAHCTDEEYRACTVIIDGDTYNNVAIRAKGNTSLSQVAAYGNDRYSFKIEFDHYENAKSYHGLDKLCLNNIIQDNTYMKDYLTYQLMHSFGVDAPLCSYVYITVNGEDWGLYVAVEGVEEAFLKRNYGNDYGNLYKPDSMGIGAGFGNGEKPGLDKPQMEGRFEGQQSPDDFAKMDLGESRAENKYPIRESIPYNSKFAGFEKEMDKIGIMANSSDVSLIYTDDEYESYPNIFDNAKTKITDEDKKRLILSLKELNHNENIENIVDIEEVIRYFVIHNFVLNFDSYTGTMVHNYYLYEKDGRLSMIPWDYNLAFGGFMDETDATTLINYPIDTPVSGGTIDTRPMLAWIFNNEEYIRYYHQYFEEFLTNYFDDGQLVALIESTEAMISPYVEKDPTKFCSYEDFKKGISTLQEFCILRAESISGQLEGLIPADHAGQEQDDSTLIGGADIVISEMGSMGEGMKMPGLERRNEFEPGK